MIVPIMVTVTTELASVVRALLELIARLLHALMTASLVDLASITPVFAHRVGPTLTALSRSVRTTVQETDTARTVHASVHPSSVEAIAPFRLA